MNNQVPDNSAPLAGNRIDEKAERVKQATSSAVASTKDAVDRAADHVEEGLHRATDKAADAANRVTDKAQAGEEPHRISAASVMREKRCRMKNFPGCCCFYALEPDYHPAPEAAIAPSGGNRGACSCAACYAIIPVFQSRTPRAGQEWASSSCLVRAVDS